MKVTGPRHVTDVAHHLPALAENRRPLALEELRIVVDPGRQAVMVLFGLSRRGHGVQFSQAGSSVHSGGFRAAVIERSYNSDPKWVKPPWRPNAHRWTKSSHLCQGLRRKVRTL